MHLGWEKVPERYLVLLPPAMAMGINPHHMLFENDFLYSSSNLENASALPPEARSPSALSHPFFGWEGSPKIDRKSRWRPSDLEDLVFCSGRMGLRKRTKLRTDSFADGGTS